MPVSFKTGLFHKGDVTNLLDFRKLNVTKCHSMKSLK